MRSLVKLNRWVLYKFLKKLSATETSESDNNPEISAYKKLTNFFNRVLPYGVYIYTGYAVIVCIGSK